MKKAGIGMKLLVTLLIILVLTLVLFLMFKVEVSDYKISCESKDNCFSTPPEDLSYFGFDSGTLEELKTKYFTNDGIFCYTSSSKELLEDEFESTEYDVYVNKCIVRK
jgi:hypothetical protein